MAATPVTGFALLEDGQAGAVVPPNELFARLDLFGHLILRSATTTAQPASPAEGDLYALPASPTGAVWAGNGGKLAGRLGGAWVFAAPVEGMRATILDEGRVATFRAGAWRSAAFGAAAGFGLRVAEAEVDLTGTTVTAAALVPAGAHLLGVRSEVLTTVAGVTGFRVGRSGALAEYGTLTGLAAGSAYHGMAQGQTVYAATDILVSADGGTFTGGRLRLTAGLIRFD